MLQFLAVEGPVLWSGYEGSVLARHFIYIRIMYGNPEGEGKREAAA
jgi:hypothetical protein